MGAPLHGQAGPGIDGCAELRASVASLCDAARTAHGTYLAAAERTRELRRRHVASEHQRETAAQAADPQRRAEEKAQARAVFERARELATGDRDQAAAIGEWARAIDRINRSSRTARRMLTKARAESAQLAQALQASERAEQAARMSAEAAEAACLDARVRLATCEEQALVPPTGQPGVFTPHAAMGGHAVAVPDVPRAEPLVMEALLAGDRAALDRVALRIGEHTGQHPAAALLQLQELIDAVVAAAYDDGFLLFDQGHHFWARLTWDESKDVVTALARLGFQVEPGRGWSAGRAPAPSDLSMALAYAGQDARQMRELPAADELRVLPLSVGVDARAFLAARAPDLALDHVVSILGRRAERLGPLWDEWGQVRPLLLSDRRSLDGPG